LETGVNGVTTDAEVNGDDVVSIREFKEVDDDDEEEEDGKEVTNASREIIKKCYSEKQAAFMQKITESGLFLFPAGFNKGKVLERNFLTMCCVKPTVLRYSRGTQNR